MCGQRRDLAESGKGLAARVPPLPPSCDSHALFCAEAWAGIAEQLGLSPRQVQILQGMLADESEDEIARALDLSKDTIHTHMGRLHEKLGAHSRIQLAVQVFRACHAWHFASSPPRNCSLRRRLESP